MYSYIGPIDSSYLTKAPYFFCNWLDDQSSCGQNTSRWPPRLGITQPDDQYLGDTWVRGTNLAVSGIMPVTSWWVTEPAVVRAG